MSSLKTRPTTCAYEMKREARPSQKKKISGLLSPTSWPAIVLRTGNVRRQRRRINLTSLSLDPDSSDFPFPFIRQGKRSIFLFITYDCRDTMSSHLNLHHIHFFCSGVMYLKGLTFQTPSSHENLLWETFNKQKYSDSKKFQRLLTMDHLLLTRN